MAAAEVKTTQNTIEFVEQNPSAGTVQATQNTIEWTSWGLGDPRNEIWVSQNCIEVAFPYGEGGGDEGGGGGPAPPP